MKLRRLLPVLFFAAAVFVSTDRVQAQTEILTFDDLPRNNYLIQNGYGALQWNNFGYMDVTTVGVSGYQNAVVSANDVAYSVQGNAATLSGSKFNLNSAYLTGAWNDGLQVEVQGLRASKIIYDHTFTVNSSGPTLIDFNYLNIDSVKFTSSGGVPHPGFARGVGEQFAMDNLSVTLVPEPSTSALIGLGATLRLISHRKKKSA